ncbi:tetratricopeptide repeat protein [candidate division CSSED10-310 bacterium]|uniref:Tetratricopeptide repeat protein n=1 Tax=candidate division CSSED10-310 bacterium TaxID=2855610 RepID=A0ABV6YX90_UNCC1
MKYRTRKINSYLVAIGAIMFAVSIARVQANTVEKEDFTVALRAFQDGLLDLSRQQFEIFREKYPKSYRSSTALFFLGEISFQGKEYARAEKEFGLFQKKYPRHDKAEEALFRLGRCYFLQRKYLSAAQTYKGIPVRFTQSQAAGTASYWAGESLFLKKRYAEALPEFTASIARRDTNKFYEYSLLRKGICLYELKSYQEAIADFMILHNLSPEQKLGLEAEYLMLKAHFLDQDYEQFITQAQKRLQHLTPKHRAEIVTLIATAYLQLNEIAQNITFLEGLFGEADAQKNYLPFYPELLHLLGTSYLKNKNYEKAIDVFTRIESEFKKTRYAREALINLAHIHTQLGQIDEAELHYKLYLTKYPADAMRVKVLQGLGQLNNLRHQYQEARDYFMDAQKLAKGREKAVILLMVADTLKATQKHEEAIKIYDQIIKQYKSELDIYEQAFLQIGLCAYFLQDYAKAILQFKTFILEFPASALINKSRYWLGETFFQTKDYETAIIAFQEYLRFTTEPVLKRKIEEKIAFALVQEQRFEEALVYYNQLRDELIKIGQGEEILIQIAYCYEQLKARKNSIETYELFLKHFPEGTHAKSVRVSLIHLLLELEDGERALAQLEQLPITKMEPAEKWLYHVQKGRAFDFSKRYVRGEEEYKTALNENVLPEQQCIPRYYLAQNLWHQKRATDAYNLLIEIIKNYPQSDYAMKGLDTFREYTLIDQDFESYLNILEIAQTTGEPALVMKSLYLQGLYYSRAGQLDRALEKFNSLITSSQDQNQLLDKALLRSGLIYENQQDYHKAAARYQSILSGGISEKIIAQAKLRLEKLKGKITPDSEPAESNFIPDNTPMKDVKQ